MDFIPHDAVSLEGGRRGGVQTYFNIVSSWFIERSIVSQTHRKAICVLRRTPALPRQSKGT